MAQFLFALVFISVGYVVKSKIDANFGSEGRPLIKRWVYLRPRRNIGLAGGRASGQPWLAKLVSSAALLVMLALAVWLWPQLGGLGRWGLALMISGGGGNLLDRWLRGYVVDYLSFPVLGRPLGRLIYNVADLLLLPGGLMLICDILLNG